MTSTAVERWMILKRSILAASRKTQEDVDQITRVSVRSFSSFELFKITDIVGDELNSSLYCQAAAGRVWKRYSYEIEAATCDVVSNEEASTMDGAGTGMKQHKRVSAVVGLLSPKTSLEAMMGFNNTGNVCVWPSEEVLAHYCLENKERFLGKSVCELGGGMSCLAGLMLALACRPSRVMLTDGNAASVENVRCILNANVDGLSGACVSSDVLLWDEAFIHTEHSTFDYVICADCLFFVELHQILCLVVQKLLVPGGTALLFNPARSGTLEQFVEVAERFFTVKKCERYSEVVWEKHCAALTNDRYKSDLHYPILLVLEPKISTNQQ